MKVNINQLSSLKKEVLKYYILQHPKRPVGFGGVHCIRLNPLKFDEHEIKAAVAELTDIGYFIKKDDSSFIMPLDVYRSARQQFRIKILSKIILAKLKQFFFSKFIAGLVSGIITGIMLMYFKAKLGL